MNKKILIAEDEKSYAKALSLKLSNAGYDVAVANNGEEAIDFLKKESFDLLFLDLIMPKVNGFGVLEFIHQKQISIKVVIFSSLSQKEDVDRSLELGAVEFVNKSDISISEALDLAKKYLN